MSLGDDTLAQPRFQYGNLVRVKPGVRHYDYPDLPIGGWAGEIVQIEPDDEDERIYRVNWSIETLENMPRIYIERCERDDFEDGNMWLADDELEADDGTPLTMESPTVPEWARHAGDEQLAAIFGLGEDDSIPDTDIESLAKYYQFLSAHLVVPFEATFDPDDDPIGVAAKVVELLPPTEKIAFEGYGLACLVDHGDEVAQVECLVELFVPKDHHNFQLLADYRHWIYGGNEDDEDEDGWGDEEYDEEDDFDDEDDEYGPNSVVGRIFKATMNGLRSGHDILGELPNHDELQRVQSLAEALILSDLEPEQETEQELEQDEAPRPLRKSGPQAGRNEPCPCGSGKKYKKCCLKQRE